MPAPHDRKAFIVPSNLEVAGDVTIGGRFLPPGATGVAVLVAAPTSGSTPGKPGYYALSAAGDYRYDYTGDGTTHSWGYTSLNKL